MSDDLIKMSDAIKVVWGDDINPNEDGMVFEVQSHIDRDIRLIPSADRPQGEWIDMYRNGFGNMIYMCSKCNFQAERSNFCPNCGAKMKGANDEQ